MISSSGGFSKIFQIFFRYFLLFDQIDFLGAPRTIKDTTLTKKICAAGDCFLGIFWKNVIKKHTFSARSTNVGPFGWRGQNCNESF